jgi:PAS domain S-box-containing protein
LLRFGARAANVGRMPLLPLPRDAEVFGSILESVPAGVVHVAADGAILAANDEALTILGLRYDELADRYVRDFEPETFREDGTRCPASDYPVTRALKTGLPQPPVTIGVSRGDQITWAVYRAIPLLDPETRQVTGAVATFLDVTEQKHAQAALRASEEKWRSVGQNVPDFVCMVDRDTRIVSLNRMAKGFDESSVIGSYAGDFIAPEDRSVWRRVIDEVFADGKPRRVEARGDGDDRAVRWYETHVGPVRGERGIEAVILVARDVTEHRALLRQLAEKERLASVGMLAASVAHEINNPLTYVLANLEFALDARGDDASRRERALADARAGAERVRQIVRDLKILAQPERDGLLFVDLRSVVEAAVRLAGPEVSHRATVSIELDDPPCLFGSESRLIRLFINLFVNAAHAIEARGAGMGRIVVSTRSGEGDQVGVEVRDDGTGIPPESLARIFEPFFTTKQPTSGSGLGLAISRDIVEGAGGRIEVASEMGRGSTFTVWLPTSAPPRERAAAPPASGAVRRMRVLVVDDDPLVIDAVERSLGKIHHIRGARGGAEGLRVVNEDDLDVVVCDLKMPELGGLELQRRTADSKPALARRFVFVTGGLVDREIAARIAACGARLVRKPFSAAELAAAISEIEPPP